ncbi:hypothetical protein D6779_02415 [Candidatus Parcubacteria bacterium]|nr:MAG: hypothetical protein D6779_02415 [Candidatus Parcubacteria bacterium]
MAGALIGSGFGIVATPSLATSATLASTATSLIGAGVSASTTEISYIANNPGKFETSSFLVTTGVSAVEGAVIANPNTGALVKYTTQFVGDQIIYGATTDDWNLSDATVTGVSSLATVGFNEYLDYWARQNLIIDSKVFTPGNPLASKEPLATSANVIRTNVAYSITSVVAGSSIGYIHDKIFRSQAE